MFCSGAAFDAVFDAAFNRQTGEEFERGVSPLSIITIIIFNSVD
jgi:hypothetical protein